MAILVVSFFIFCFIFILFMCFEKIAPVMSVNESDADILHGGGEMYVYISQPIRPSVKLCM